MSSVSPHCRSVFSVMESRLPEGSIIVVTCDGKYHLGVVRFIGPIRQSSASPTESPVTFPSRQIVCWEPLYEPERQGGATFDGTLYGVKYCSVIEKGLFSCATHVFCVSFSVGVLPLPAEIVMLILKFCFPRTTAKRAAQYLLCKGLCRRAYGKLTQHSTAPTLNSQNGAPPLPPSVALSADVVAFKRRGTREKPVKLQEVLNVFAGTGRSFLHSACPSLPLPEQSAQLLSMKPKTKRSHVVLNQPPSESWCAFMVKGLEWQSTDSAEMVALIQSMNQADIYRRDFVHSLTPLAVATHAANHAAVAELLSRGALSVLPRDGISASPLYVAAARGNVPIMELLAKEAGWEIFLGSWSNDGLSPMEKALEAKHWDAARHILECTTAVPKRLRSCLCTHPQLCFADEASQRMWKNLFQMVPSFWNYGLLGTLLHVVVGWRSTQRQQHLSALQFVCDSAPVNILKKTDWAGNTCLHTAAAAGTGEVVELLLTVAALPPLANEWNSQNELPITAALRSRTDRQRKVRALLPCTTWSSIPENVRMAALCQSMASREDQLAAAIIASLREDADVVEAAIVGARAGAQDALRHLFRKYPDAAAAFCQLPYCLCSPLTAAIGAGQTRTAQWLIEDCHAPVAESHDYDARQPSFVAASLECWTILNMIVSHEDFFGSFRLGSCWVRLLRQWSAMEDSPLSRAVEYLPAEKVTQNLSADELRDVAETAIKTRPLWDYLGGSLLECIKAIPDAESRTSVKVSLFPTACKHAPTSHAAPDLSGF